MAWYRRGGGVFCRTSLPSNPLSPATTTPPAHSPATNSSKCPRPVHLLAQREVELEAEAGDQVKLRLPNIKECSVHLALPGFVRSTPRASEAPSADTAARCR